MLKIFCSRLLLFVIFACAALTAGARPGLAQSAHSHSMAAMKPVSAEKEECPMHKSSGDMESAENAGFRADKIAVIPRPAAHNPWLSLMTSCPRKHGAAEKAICSDCCCGVSSGSAPSMAGGAGLDLAEIPGAFSSIPRGAEEAGAYTRRLSGSLILSPDTPPPNSLSL